jgi:tetratricopeptide (TPR) repeat protein
VELDPGLSDAYVALGDVHRALDWNWTAAEAAYRTAVALSPSCENAHQSMAVFLSAIGRHDEAKREAERARWLGPICLSINTSAGWVRYAAGEYDEAINQCRHTLEMASEYASARRLLGASYVAAGMYREAIRELEIVAGHDCAQAVSIAWLAQAKAAAGKTDEAGWIVRELEQPDDGKYVPGYHLAMVYVALNDFDRAFSLLDRACDDRDPALAAIGVEPRFDPLRRDPRYPALLDRLGLRALSASP